MPEKTGATMKEPTGNVSRKTLAGDGRRLESLADFRSTDADKRREMIALEAYYAAERRGFEGDGEIEDWLQAEHVVDARLAEETAPERAALAEAAAGLGKPARRKPSRKDAPRSAVDAIPVEKQERIQPVVTTP
jgi:hypothetical protein